LYNAYVAVLALTDTDVNSVLNVDQQQLALYTHFSQTVVILALLSDNVLFIQICITSQQMRTHQSSYINAILIQSQNVIIHQNISVSVAATASDVIMLLTVLYTTTMYSLSSQTMRMTTVLMRVSTLLNQGELHQLCCQ